MKRDGIVLVLLLMVIPPSIGAYDTRLLSLDSPTLSQSMGAPSVLPNLLFPTDEFGLGVSAIPDSLDIWKLPQQLANTALFPSSVVILDYVGPVIADGNAGLVVALEQLPLVLGIFCNRPDRNGWVIGMPRSDLPGHDTYLAEGTAPATMQIATGPNAPGNVADLILALRLGNLALGAGAGFSYDQALNRTRSISGTADSSTTETASSQVFTVRAGASLAFTTPFPLSVDLGTILMMGNSSATFRSGALAPVPGEDDSITALNNAFGVSARIAVAVSSTLQVFFLGDFASLDQGFGASDNGVPFKPGSEMDLAGFTSFGFGTGINWTPAPGFLVNALISGTLGTGHWTSEPPSGIIQPADSGSSTTLRCLIDGEFPLLSWLIVRGGIGARLSFITFVSNVAAGGTADTIIYTERSPSAAAGLGILLTDRVTLDLALDLANFMTSAAFQTPVIQASLKADL